MKRKKKINETSGNKEQEVNRNAKHIRDWNTLNWLVKSSEIRYAIYKWFLIRSLVRSHFLS